MYNNADEYYGKIIKAVENLLDGKWEQIVIRIWKDECQSSIGVYCRIKNVFKFIGDYLSTGELAPQHYSSINRALLDISSEMQNELREKGQKIWSCAVFTLMKDGHVETEYSYEDFPENEFKENLNWKYKRLGILPNEKNMKYLDRD